MLGPDDLVITGSTLGNPPFAELVLTAAAAGFAGLSLWPEPTYGRARTEGLSDHEMRARLDDAGIVVHDVDALCAWVGPDDPGGPYLREAAPDVLFGAAEQLRARYINVVLVGMPGTSLDACSAVFAGLCDQSAQHGLRVAIEFSPPGSGANAPGAGSVVTNINDALTVVRDAGRSNGSVLVDTWHFHWGPSTFADLAAADGALIGAIQCNDAPAEEPEDMAYARAHHRLAPGDGAIDLTRFLRTIRARGCTAPVTVEVFNRELLDRLGPDRLARRLHDDVVAIIEKAAS
jgi:sugar phosphate isomerase/epimerase